MSEHNCDECGTDRTDILGRFCESCHEWAEGLDVDYEEWREDINADEEDADEGDDNEAADNGESETVEKDGYELAHGDKLVSDGNEITIKIINGQVRLQDGPTRPVIANDGRIQHYVDLGYELVQDSESDSDSDSDDDDTDEKRLMTDGGQIESEPANNVERFDILLTPPGITRGGGYDRPTAMIVLDVQDGATMLVDDRGHRRGPFEPGHIQERVADGAMINVGPASVDMRRYFRDIDREHDDSPSRRPDLASERLDQLHELIHAGLSPAEALDYWMVEDQGWTQSGWASERDRNQQAISKNVRKAREKLSSDTEGEQ